jgi:MFS family permease
VSLEELPRIRPSDAPGGSAGGPRQPIPPDVWSISFTSLFADWGYEMVLPVLPFFLAFSLAASPFIVGLVDGAAQFGQSVMSTVSGDRWSRGSDRRSRAVLSYAITGAAHGLIALTTTWPQVLVLRVSAWLGRGTRQPIKGAMLANASPPGQQGRTFGLEQALDSAGAIIGTAVAVAILAAYAYGPGADPTPAFRMIFLVSVIPSAVAVIIILFIVRDRGRPAAEPTPPDAGSPPVGLPRSFRWFLAAEAVFGLGYFSILLALLRVGENLLPSTGGSIAAITITALLLYLLYNILYTVVAYPAGHFSDRSPGLWLVAVSFVLFALVDVFLVVGGGLLLGILAFIVAGVQVGIQGVAESAWVARHVSPHLVGRAFGRLGTVQGLTILVGSLLVGGLWTFFTPAIAFATSGVLCVLGALMLWPASRGASAGPLPAA